MTRRAAVVVALGLLLSGCGSARYGAPPPGTEEADDVLALWRVLFWAAAAIGALVLALLAWCIVRYRARPDDDTLPRQHKGNVPLEVFYTAVPVVIVAALFTYNLVVDHRLREERDPDVVIDVTGFQWQWRFDYEAEDVTVAGAIGEPPELVLPTGRVVRLRLRTADVVHSFFVPGFLVKRDLIPGTPNTIELRPTRTGFYRGHCAEFCGLDHARMNFDVRVVTPDEFDRWVRGTRA